MHAKHQWSSSCYAQYANITKIRQCSAERYATAAVTADPKLCELLRVMDHILRKYCTVIDLSSVKFPYAQERRHMWLAPASWVEKMKRALFVPKEAVDIQSVLVATKRSFCRDDRSAHMAGTNNVGSAPL